MLKMEKNYKVAVYVSILINEYILHVMKYNEQIISLLDSCNTK
jgi:hypothetical protein